MPEISELLKKVRQVEIIANKAVNDLFAGQYKSTFRGQGMEFCEVREYQPGDDIRTIDWNVTARVGRPFIKRFVEERELTILFLVDVSASGIFGSSQSKLTTAIELTATLMFSALKNNDKVGLVTFADTVKSFYKPRKGKANVLHLLRELLALQDDESVQQSTSTDLRTALDYVNRIQKRRAVIFLLSDFLVPDLMPNQNKNQESLRLAPSRQDQQLTQMLSTIRQQEHKSVIFKKQNVKHRREEIAPTERALSICARKHDLIAMPISDHLETDFPNAGLITLQDPETGETIEVDSANPQIRELLAKQFRATNTHLESALKRSRIDRIAIESGNDFLVNLRKFFRKRSKG